MRWNHDRIPKMDSDGRPVLDSDGQPVLEDNPYNVVVSVMMLKEGWDVRNVKVIVPLRPCDSRTLTEQTLGRGLRKMHPPILDEDGGASMQKEELYVIEHPSFRSIIDQIHDIVDLKSSDEIEHSREYVPILQKADLTEREAAGVRLVRFEGMREVVPDWRKSFDLERVPALSPRLAWMEDIADTEIHTYLKEALAAAETDGQVFVIPEVPSYRDFDHIIEVAMAVPMLREMRTSFHGQGHRARVPRAQDLQSAHGDPDIFRPHPRRATRAHRAREPGAGRCDRGGEEGAAAVVTGSHPCRAAGQRGAAIRAQDRGAGRLSGVEETRV
jgi:hypothetical protein